MMAVKRNSSEWVNQNRLTFGRFEWQEGYGAFSYGRSQIPDVIKYIENQKIHHATKSLTEEYRKCLDDFGVEYDNRYILHDVI